MEIASRKEAKGINPAARRDRSGRKDEARTTAGSLEEACRTGQAEIKSQHADSTTKVN